MHPQKIYLQTTSISSSLSPSKRPAIPVIHPSQMRNKLPHFYISGIGSFNPIGRADWAGMARQRGVCARFQLIRFNPIGREQSRKVLIQFQWFPTNPI
jgi:hypothetical protein